MLDQHPTLVLSKSFISALRNLTPLGLDLREKANEAIYTFVAVDENGNPTAVPPVNPETELEKTRYDAALRRRQLSLILAKKLSPDDATELKALFED